MSENVKIGYGLTGAPGGEVSVRAYRPGWPGEEETLHEGTFRCIDLAQSHETAVWLEPGCMDELSEDDLERAFTMVCNELKRRAAEIRG